MKTILQIFVFLRDIMLYLRTEELSEPPIRHLAFNMSSVKSDYQIIWKS